MSMLSNSAKFSASRPILPAYNFSATMATTYRNYRLGAVASLKFLAIENMPPYFSAHAYYGQTAGWIRIPLGTEVCLGPDDVRWGPSSIPTEMGTAALTLFDRLWCSNSPIAAAAEHLYVFCVVSSLRQENRTACAPISPVNVCNCRCKCTQRMGSAGRRIRKNWRNCNFNTFLTFVRYW